MVKYNLIIEQSLHSTALKRVRIKVDPSLVHKVSDLTGCDGYEGYILAECGENYKVLVVAPGEAADMSVMEVPGDQLEDIDDGFDVVGAFIEFVLNKHRVSLDSGLGDQLSRANTVEQVESILKQTGYTDDDVKILYRDFIASEGPTPVNEGIGQFLKQGAQAVAKATSVAANVAGTAANVAGTIIGGQHLGADLKSAGSKLKSVGQWANNKAQEIKGKREADILKKLERPQGDPKNGSKVNIDLKFLSDQVLPREINKTQNTPNGRVYTVFIKDPNKPSPQPLKADVDEIRFTDEGHGYNNVYYYSKNKQVQTQSDWPKQIGLHYNDQRGYWDINTDLSDVKKTNLDKIKEFLTNYKNDKFKLNNNQKQLIQRSKSYNELHTSLLKSGITPELYDQVIGDFYGKSSPASTTDTFSEEPTTKPPSTAVNTGINARTAEGNPVSGQTRFTTKDKTKSYIYGKDGWKFIDPKTKQYIKVKNQKQITTAWQKSQGITPAVQSNESLTLSVMEKYLPDFLNKF